MPIKVVDLFSGPGGLGEGFSSFKTENGTRPFKLAVSIEKDEAAHKTLFLRSFFRQFEDDVPVEYYEFLKGRLGKSPDDQLYKFEKFREQYNAAGKEALCLELGKNNEIINERIEEAIGDDEFILIGGPPCQAYSLVGRARNKGISNYRAEDDHRNFLYKEYLKVIARFQPKAFVMENVKGMLSAKVDGRSIYEEIIKDLESPHKAIRSSKVSHKHNYRIYSLVTNSLNGLTLEPQQYVIKSENYGIPQRRHRVILVGIRDDITVNSENLILERADTKFTVFDAISDLPSLRSGLSKEVNTDLNWLKSITTNSTKTLKALEKAKYFDVAEEFRSVVNNLTCPANKQGSNFGVVREKSLKKKALANWFYDKNLGKYVPNHESRGHISEDLQRYLFCSSWAKVAEREGWEVLFPKSNDYPPNLMPNHKNFKSGKFADRFRTQVWSLPATTITSHISKDGHYYIHPDPLQVRSFTVREAARIQTFPDNYFFCGNRTQQYVQVGNAVPPLLATQIAKIIFYLT